MISPPSLFLLRLDPLFSFFRRLSKKSCTKPMFKKDCLTGKIASLFLGICPTRVGSVFFSVTKTSEGPDSSLRGGLKQLGRGR